MRRVGEKPFVFISAVSHEFDTLRDKLRFDINSPHAAAHVRSDFIPNDDFTLFKLDQYIQKSSIFVHIVGQHLGRFVPQTEIEAFCLSCPEFRRFLNQCAEYRSGLQAMTYTQFEGLLAIFHKKILIPCAITSFEGNQTDAMEASQYQHFQRLKDDFHREFLFFDDQEELRIQLLRTTSICLLRTGMLHELSSAKLIQKADITGTVEVRTKDAILASRRRSSERRTSWQSVFRSEHFLREELLGCSMEEIDEFLTNTPPNEYGKLNVFCISGRSGDGKSTLLWQVAREFLRSGKVTEIYAVPNVSNLADALAEIASRPNPGPIFIDDIHQLMYIKNESGDLPDTLSDGIGALLDMGVNLPPIISCGPTPEVASFSARNRGLFNVQTFEIPSLSDRDRTCFGEWFGLELSDGVALDDLLVVFLFELLQGESISAFSKSFSARLDNQNAFDAAKCVIAASVIDVNIDQEILSFFDGGSFLERLTETDQRHFNMDGSTVSGKQGIEFSHPQVSLRLFSEWTTDVDLGESVSKELGRHLAPAFIVSQDDLVQCRALANSAAFRLLHGEWSEPNLKGATNFLEASTRHLRDYPDACAVVTSAMLMSIYRSKKPALTAGLVRTAANLCQHPKVSDSRRIEIAAPLLGLVEETSLENGEEIEKWVFDLLFGVSGSTSSATAILFLCANLKFRPNFWISWALFWLYLHPKDPSAPGLITWLVANNNYHPNRCSQLLEEFFKNASTELKTLILDKVSRSDAIKAYSDDRWLKNWFEENGSMRSIEPALRVLARNVNHESSEWLALICDRWMEANAGLTGVCDIMSALIDNKILRPRYLPNVPQFVQINKDLPSIDDTIMSYLKATENTKLQGSAIDIALDWVESRQMDDNTSKMIEKLQVFAKHRPELVELGVRWLTKNWNQDSGATMVNALLRNVSSHPDSARISVAWVEDHLGTAGIQLCIGQLLKIGEQGSISLARNWLKKNSDTKGSHAIAVGLLNESSAFPELVEDVKSWLEETNISKGLNLVFDAFLKNEIEIEFAIEAHCEFIREQAYAPNALHSLPSLLKRFPDHDKIGAIAREALDGTLRNHDFVVVLGAYCSAYRNDPKLQDFMTQLFVRRVPVHHASGVLSNWLRATEIEHSSWQFVLEMRQQADLRDTDQQAFYSLCNALAYNACKTLTLAVSVPDAQRNLIDSLRIGSKNSESLGEMLRDCMEIWPTNYRAELWNIVLENDWDSFPDYREEFLNWFTGANSAEYGRISSLIRKLIARGLIDKEILRKGL